MVSRIIPVDNFDLVVFGATGDLAMRKIFPALYHRFIAQQMPADARIIGVARSDVSEENFRKLVQENLQKFCPQSVKQHDNLQDFLNNIQYISIDVHGDKGWALLQKAMRADDDTDNNIVQAFYLSVNPSLFGIIASKLKQHHIAHKQSRIIIEKPFGTDAASAKALNAALRTSFSEQQIYRIDHYLGKETVQNLMVLRFANALWEPLWNSTHIDHVQITVAENIGVQGRGEYYDKSGAMRDMVQNHLMQLLCLTAMEPPSRFHPDAVRNEKVKVIESLEPVAQTDIVRGQYLASNINGDADGSYHQHVNNPDSMTESYIAMKVNIGNWRWAGTPFYLRTGKKLRSRCSEIAIIFREPPHMIFPKSSHQRANSLIIRLQPNEKIDLHTMAKEAGLGGMRLTEAVLNMNFQDTINNQLDVQDAYERLIMDVIRGSQTLFMRDDEVEAAWEWIDPIIDGWHKANHRPLPYEAGSAGPDDALMLMHRDGRRWQEIEP
ncbi:MAG: glucose-6-phosphate dehydrogenase [Alphaproteobacteria bacterium]|nr:glucose-6-phosphate dehydrogenase [Alphaproteobacteria bacterium]